MNIVLINPPMPAQRTTFPPIGLAYISAALKKAGYSVRCIDGYNMSWQFLEKFIVKAKPDIVGITCWTFARANTFNTANLIKKCYPKAKIIIGGQHATFLPGQTIVAANADFIVLGEGEDTIVELIKSIQDGEDFSKIKGICYRKGEDIIINPKRPMISDSDDIPFPDYSNFNLDDYSGLPETGRRAAGIITSRGCPFDCNYCSSKEYWTRQWRFRSANNIVSEIEYLYHELGVRALMFFDDNFTVKKDRVIKICKEIIKRKLDLIWACIGSVRVVDKEILTWMCKAGCYQVQYGVESGSPKILKNINKGQTVEQTRNAFRQTREAGMEALAYLMVGAPGETQDTINETIQLMRDIAPKQNPSGGINILWILPGTKIYQLSKSQGIICDKTWIESDDEYFYYTGEYSVEQLEGLRMQLRKGLAQNGGTLFFLSFILRSYLKEFKVFYNFYTIYKSCKHKVTRLLSVKAYSLRKGQSL